MGYHTDFEGEVKFTQTLPFEAFSVIDTWLLEDIRDHYKNLDEVYQGGKYGNHWYFIDLVWSEGYEGLQWSESEKTHSLHHILNWLTDKVREVSPDFDMEGELEAWGEEAGDHYFIRKVNGRWEKVYE